MPIAVFGSKVFEVTDSKIYTLGDMQYSSTLETEKQDAEGTKPSTYNKGPSLNTFGFTLKLNAVYGTNPRSEMEDWERIKDAGVAYSFILGRSPLGLGNKWLLVELQASNLVVDNVGNILAADLALKFDEYVRPGAAKEKKDAKSKGNVIFPGLLQPDDEGTYGPEDKSGYKRDNPEMTRDSWLALK